MSKNLATFFVDDAAVALREAEVPDADWVDGMNRGGSNACGIGINTGDYDPKESDWPRPDPTFIQTSQIIGGTANYIDMQSLPTGGDTVNTAFVQADAPVAPDAVIGVVEGVEVYNRTGKTVPAGAWVWGATIAALGWIALTRGLNSGDTTIAIRSVATDADGVWVAGFDSGWASRSTDNGVTWTALTRGLNSGSTTSNIYTIAADGAGVWVAGLQSGYAARSTDNGATWTALTRGLNSGADNVPIRSVATDADGVWVAGIDLGWVARNITNGL